MKKTIQFAIDPETKFPVSRLGDEVAFVELSYAAMTPKNGYQQSYKLSKAPIFEVVNWFNGLISTKKIDKSIKNAHREFWGLKPLK